MNENQLKMIVPPTVGFIVAGVASGIFYLLIESFRKGKSSKSVFYDDSRCACCLKPFLVGRGVECNDCGARSCRKACCRWDSLEDSWFCLFCYHNKTWARRREKWFRSFGGLPSATENSKNFSTAKCQVYDEGAEHVAIHAELDLAAGGRREGDSMETVREFVEKIVEGLVGNVDDTPIDRLYDHPDYKPATDTPTMAHTALRELVERAVDEARKLPCLGATVSTTVHEDSTYSEQNYEDLLATAILNKVIEKFQNERVDGNSNVVHRRIRSKYTNHDNEIGLDEGVEEGSSSLEPLSQDDCSSEGSGSRARHARIRKEPISLTIEEQIEEVTTYGSDEDLRSSKTNVLDFRNSRRVPFPEFGMDIVDPSQDSSDESQDESSDLGHVDMITPIESWEENWLFQKRKIQTHSEPVSMLVPNPSADYRALIGDKDAEDTSDLSEFSAQSEDETEEDELLIEAINGSVPRSSKIKIEDETKFDEALYGNEKIVESLKNENSIEFSIDDIDDKDESCVEKEFENVYRQNIDDRNKIDENLLFPDSKQENRDSGLSEKSFDPAKYSEKYSQMPKTPVFSPKRNSPVNNDPKVPRDFDPSKSNYQLVEFVDKNINEDSNLRANSTVQRHDEQSRDNIVDKTLSSCDVSENFKQSTMSGCLEDVERETGKKLVEKNNRPEEKTVENSAKEETTSNGNPEKIEDFKTITDSLSEEEKKSEKQSTAKTKVVSTPPEKEILKNESDNEIGLATPPRPGTIAEREHKKWENAAPIENNPYSEENIQKRLLERQYARRSSSDLSGSSTKLATSPSPPLQIVLGAGRPDFKRFGRDYYINEAKTPNGRSIETGFYTATSRPNSSLSQNSLSTGSDYEHQVSHGLEILEERALRESLRRRSYRGQNSSPNFVTNPLLHLEDLIDNENERNWLIDASSGGRNRSSQEKNDIFEESIEHSIGKNEFLKNEKNFQEIQSALFSLAANNHSILNPDKISRKNPLYQSNNIFSRNDRDSGLCSIDSIDFIKINDHPATQKNDENFHQTRSPRLCCNYEKNDNACTHDGRKYLTTSFHKFHTFGGIKRRRYRTIDEDDLDNSNDFSTHLSLDSTNDLYDAFAHLKFQTFGGIKSDRTKDRARKFRRQKIRASMRVLENREQLDDRMSGIFKKSHYSTANNNYPRDSTLQSSIGRASSDCLRLQKPNFPEVVQISFQSLRDIREADKSKRKNTKSAVDKS